MLIKFGGKMSDILVKTILDKKLNKEEVALIKKQGLVLRATDGKWHLTSKGRRVFQNVPNI